MRAVQNCMWPPVRFAGTWLLCGHRKNANYFSLTHTRSAGKAAADASCAYTICHHCRGCLVHCTECVCSLSALPAARSRRCRRRCMLVGCLPVSTLRYRYFCCARTQCSVCAVCIIWWSRCSLVRSLASPLPLLLCVCVCVCLPLPLLPPLLPVVSVCFACFGCALPLPLPLPLLAWYSCFSWISVQFSIDDARSTFCSAFHSAHSVQFSARLIFRPCRAKSEVNTAQQQHEQQQEQE